MNPRGRDLDQDQEEIVEVVESIGILQALIQGQDRIIDQNHVKNQRKSFKNHFYEINIYIIENL